MYACVKGTCNLQVLVGIITTNTSQVGQPKGSDKMNGAGSKLPIMKSIRSPDNAVFLNPPASEEIAPQVSQISQAGFESNEFCYKAGRKTFGSNVLLSAFISHTLLCSLSCCHPPILFVIRKYCMSTSVIPTLLSLDG